MQSRCTRKKLIAWARWYAGASSELDGTRLWDIDGKWPTVSVEYCRAVCKGERCKECPAPFLLPEAQVGITAYSICATQWRYGFGGRGGLDYPACMNMLRLKQKQWRADAPNDPFVRARMSDLMEQLQTIEAALLTADREADKNRKT